MTEDAEDGEKPRTASLFKSMSPETVTLEDVLPLLSLPRVVGVDPATARRSSSRTAATARSSRSGADTRVARDRGAAADAHARRGARPARPAEAARPRAAAAAPLRELGDDPVSGKPIVVKNGRFGPYVTDGETNASLRAGDDVETLTHERAVELMAARRERGPGEAARASAR